jgi:hypothetical protein
MTARQVRCLVPFCNCTRGDRKGDPLPADITFYEWICARHWSAVPTTWRKVYRRAWRKLDAAKAHNAAAMAECRANRVPRISNKAEFFAEYHARRALHRLWDRIKRLAIERAMGIG